MAYVNVGAENVPTKKSLRENVGSVSFYTTSDFQGSFSGGWQDFAREFPAGTKLSVVGPDPYRNRKWYATVDLSNGKVT